MSSVNVLRLLVQMLSVPILRGCSRHRITVSLQWQCLSFCL